MEVVRIHKVNDFFDNPNEIRECALNMKYESPNENQYWHGLRATPKDRVIAGVDLEKLIYEEIVFRIPNVVYDEMEISFHILLDEVREHFDESIFEEATKHIDSATCRLAGLIYLTPNPPKNCGTSFFDDEGNKVGEVDNEYNTMVLYPADIVHSPTNPFGDTIENGRLTIVFFLKKYENRVTASNSK